MQQQQQQEQTVEVKKLLLNKSGKPKVSAKNEMAKIIWSEVHTKPQTEKDEEIRLHMDTKRNQQTKTRDKFYFMQTLRMAIQQ